MNTTDNQRDVVMVNGRMPLRHWIIQGLISLTLGGIVSATAAVVAIKYDNRETRLVLSNEIKIHAVKTDQRLNDHERRITDNEQVLDKAFPRHFDTLDR